MQQLHCGNPRVPLIWFLFQYSLVLFILLYLIVPTTQLSNIIIILRQLKIIQKSNCLSAIGAFSPKKYELPTILLQYTLFVYDYHIAYYYIILVQISCLPHRFMNLFINTNKNNLSLKYNMYRNIIYNYSILCCCNNYKQLKLQ